MRNEFYYQYEREKSWTHPGARVFGRVNGGLAFQGFQCLAGNAVPLCHVFYADTDVHGIIKPPQVFVVNFSNHSDAFLFY